MRGLSASYPHRAIIIAPLPLIPGLIHLMPEVDPAAEVFLRNLVHASDIRLCGRCQAPADLSRLAHPVPRLLFLSIRSIADLQSLASHQVARPGAAPGHCTLVFDPRIMRTERSLRIGILCTFFPLRPSETSISGRATSAAAGWIFELRLHDASAVPRRPAGAARQTRKDHCRSRRSQHS